MGKEVKQLKQVMSQQSVLKTLQPEAHLSITLMEMADAGSPVGMVVVSKPCPDGKVVSFGYQLRFSCNMLQPLPLPPF